jgi:hypothetical protein
MAIFFSAPAVVAGPTKTITATGTAALTGATNVTLSGNTVALRGNVSGATNVTVALASLVGVVPEQPLAFAVAGASSGARRDVVVASANTVLVDGVAEAAVAADVFVARVRSGAPGPAGGVVHPEDWGVLPIGLPALLTGNQAVVSRGDAFPAAAAASGFSLSAFVLPSGAAGWFNASLVGNNVSSAVACGAYACGVVAARANATAGGHFYLSGGNEVQAGVSLVVATWDALWPYAAAFELSGAPPSVAPNYDVYAFDARAPSPTTGSTTPTAMKSMW